MEAFGSEEERVGGRESVRDLLRWALDLGASLSPSVALQSLDKAERKSGTDARSTDTEAISDVCLYRCVEDIQSGQELFRIPEGVLLRSDSAGKWRDHLLGIPGLKYDEGGSLSERDRLSLRLLLESCDEESHWKPYIQALPKEQPCLSSWDRETLEVDLKHTPIWKSTKAFKSNLDIVGEPSASLLECCYSLVHPTLGEEMRKKFTREQIRWCHQMVLSRAFGIRKSESEDPFPTLVPVVDLLDHSNDAKVSWTLKNCAETRSSAGPGKASEAQTDKVQKKHFHFVCDKPLAKDSQLFTNYGGKGNEELLRGYGFTLENNPFDFYIIELGIGSAAGGAGGDPNLEDSTEWGLRVDLLHQIRCKKTHALTLRDPLPVGLLAAATACILPQEEVHFLHTYERATNRPKGESQEAAAGRLGKWLARHVSHLQVLKALQMLGQQMDTALGKMCEVATIEEDESELYTYHSYNCEKAFRHLVAIHYRLGLKRILREARHKILQSASVVVEENMVLSPSPIDSDQDLRGQLLQKYAGYNENFRCIAAFYKYGLVEDLNRLEEGRSKAKCRVKGLGIFFEKGVKADSELAQIPVFYSSCMLGENELLSVKEGLDSFSPNDKAEFLQLVSLEHLLLALVIHRNIQKINGMPTAKGLVQDDREKYLARLWAAIENGHHQTLKMLVGQSQIALPGHIAHGLQFGSHFETWTYLRERFTSLMHYLRKEHKGIVEAEAEAEAEGEAEAEEESKSKRQKMEREMDGPQPTQHMEDSLWIALCIALDFGKLVPDKHGRKRCVLAPVLDCMPADILGFLFKLSGTNFSRCSSPSESGSAGRIGLYSMCDIPADSYFGVLFPGTKNQIGNIAEGKSASLHPIQKFLPHSNSALIETFGIDFCYEGNEHQFLELDLEAWKHISPYKTKLMIALSLPRVHYLRKRKNDPNHEKGLQDAEALLVCISLICIKAEKLVKLGSDKLLKYFDAYRSNQYRLQDKMHHYQTSLPLDEKQVYESEKALITKKDAFMKKLRHSSRHEQILKQAASLLDKVSLEKGDVNAHLEFQVSTLAAIRDHFKNTLIKEYSKGT